MIELWVRGEFEAAHSLADVFGPMHQCSGMHGHRYEVTLFIRSDSEEDIVVDYHELHDELRVILKKWDHTNLNETMRKASTCENIARMIFDEAVYRWDGAVYCVEVKEQRDTGCRFYGTRST